MKNKRIRGFTLVELIVVLAVLAILSTVAVVGYSHILQRAKWQADKATVTVLNKVTSVHKVAHELYLQDVFEGIGTDEGRLAYLVDEGYLTSVPEAQQKDASFQWSISEQVWELYVGDEVEALTPFGNSFADISQGIIGAINHYHDHNDAYGRTWGSYAFTDIGLDPEDWRSPIMHMRYRPIGSKLVVTPEEGYEFKVMSADGDTKTVWFGYNIIYNAQDGNWYYHSIEEANIIDIDTLQVVS